MSQTQTTLEMSAAFERRVAAHFRERGYGVEEVGGPGDGGIDLRLTHPKGLRGIVQCKLYSSPVGPGAVRDLFGALGHTGCDFAYLVTTAAFTRQAVQWVADKPIYLLTLPAAEPMAHGLTPQYAGEAGELDALASALQSVRLALGKTLVQLSEAIRSPDADLSPVHGLIVSVAANLDSLTLPAIEISALDLVRRRLVAVLHRLESLIVRGPRDGLHAMELQQRVIAVMNLINRTTILLAEAKVSGITSRQALFEIDTIMVSSIGLLEDPVAPRPLDPFARSPLSREARPPDPLTVAIEGAKARFRSWKERRAATANEPRPPPALPAPRASPSRLPKRPRPAPAHLAPPPPTSSDAEVLDQPERPPA